MNLEVKHITPYLPFKLKCYEPRFNEKHTILGLIKNEIYIGDEDSINSFVLDNETFPILRPVSSLTREIEINGNRFIPIEVLKSKGFYISDEWMEEGFKDAINSSYDFVQLLIEWHFDVFGLIEKGLAVDINTLPQSSE